MMFPNGHKYKLVYIDTNAINDISKNIHTAGRNFVLQYVTGEFAFITSAFNIYEVSKAKGESRKNILAMFDAFPLLVCHTYPQLIEFEKVNAGFHKDMIIFSIGVKGLFQTQLSDLLHNMDTSPSFVETFETMNKQFDVELSTWKRHKRDALWMNDFNVNLLSSMNESYALTKGYRLITQLGQYMSLELFAYIKNQFIYGTNQQLSTNSVIDAYNASFFPYADVYITEKAVASWLNMAMSKLEYLRGKQVIKLSSLYQNQ